MFGPLGRAGGPQARRLRRRLLISFGIFLLASLVLGELIDMVVNSYGPTNRTATHSWVAAVSPVIAESNDLAPIVQQVWTSGSSLTRTQMSTDLGALVTQTADEQDAFAEIRLPAPRAVGAELGAVLGERVHGVQQLVAAVSQATGPSRDLDSSSASLQSAGRDFQEADRAYHHARVDLGKAFDGPLAPASWISSTWSAPIATRRATALSQAPALAVQDKLAFIAISLNPAPNSYLNFPALTTTTTSTTTTTTTLPVAVSGASGAIPTTTTSTTTVSPTTTSTTTTTLPLPVGYAQIPTGGVTSVLLPSASLAVTVVVQNESGSPHSINLRAKLIPLPHGIAKVVQTTMSTASVAGYGSIYVTMAPLEVSPKAPGFYLEVQAGAAGVDPTMKTLQLAIKR